MTIMHREKIEKAIYKAINVSAKEQNHFKEFFTEENFRYIVMREIAKIGDFGSFPNNLDEDVFLIFEHNYSKDFKPDIACLRKRKNSKSIVLNTKHPLVVELKVRGKINGEDHSIHKDLKKVKEYMHKNKGGSNFEFGIVLNVGIPKKRNTKNYVKEMQDLLNNNKFKRDTYSSLNLLFGWHNPLADETELIWLDQFEPIRLQGNQ